MIVIVYKFDLIRLVFGLQFKRRILAMARAQFW